MKGYGASNQIPTPLRNSAFSHNHRPHARWMARRAPKPKIKAKHTPYDPGPLQNPENYGEFTFGSDPEGNSEKMEGLASSDTDEEEFSDEEKEPSSMDGSLPQLGEGEAPEPVSKSGNDGEIANEEEDLEENPEEVETWGSPTVVDLSKTPAPMPSVPDPPSSDSSVQRLDRVGFRSAGGRIDFRRLKDWEEVREAVRELGDTIEPRHISHAFGALKFMTPRPQREFLEELANLAIEQVQRMPPMDLAVVIHACAKMKFVYKPLITTWEKELSDAQVLEACTDMDISTIVYSAGVLQREMVWGLSGKEREGGTGFTREFINRLAEEAVHPLRVQHYSEAMLSNTFYGMALLKFAKPEILDKILEEALLPSVLPAFTVQNLASFIYSMGVVGHRHDQALRTFLQTAVERIDECTEQGLSNIVYALGQLKFTDREAMQPLWPKITDPDRLMAFTEQDLSNIVHGLGSLGISNEEVMGPIKTELLREGRLKEFRERGLTGMLYAFGQLKHADEIVLDAIVKELTGPRLRGCKPQALAVAMYSLGILKYRNMELLERLFFEVSQPQRVSMFSDQELMNVIYGLGHLRHKDEDVIIPLAEEATSPHRLRTFTQQALATIIHTFANLSFRQHHFLDKIAREVSKPGRLAQFSEQSLVLTAAGFVRLGHFDKTVFATLLDECLKPERKHTLRINPFADTMFGCLKSEAYDFDKFEAIIELFRDPERLAKAQMFPLARVLLACGQIGLRDEEFLKNVRSELLKPERVENFRDDDKRDLGRAFERLGWFDDELCNVLDFPMTGRGLGSYRRAQPPLIRAGDGAAEERDASSDYSRRDEDQGDNSRREERRMSGRGAGRGRGDTQWRNANVESRRPWDRSQEGSRRNGDRFGENREFDRSRWSRGGDEDGTEGREGSRERGRSERHSSYEDRQERRPRDSWEGRDREPRRSRNRWSEIDDEIPEERFGGARGRRDSRDSGEFRDSSQNFERGYENRGGRERERRSSFRSRQSNWKDDDVMMESGR
ncbi:hypothetical protein BSKO_03113 [Bryopsis sp. KO-2023]|nr:hypothetical protein BSKO_03113 [Bryopsis sp. KO-2023]